jgi:hypothetical protein
MDEQVEDAMSTTSTNAPAGFAANILDTPPASGECTDDCACTRAASVTDSSDVLPTGTGATIPGATPYDHPLVCTLGADGGDVVGRLGEWQAMLAQATSREEIDGGVAVSFPHDIARTAGLARLLAAEYSCCSFASYHLTIDARGVRMEIRTPAETRDALAAAFGTADHE